MMFKWNLDVVVRILEVKTKMKEERRDVRTRDMIQWKGLVKHLIEKTGWGNLRNSPYT